MFEGVLYQLLAGYLGHYVKDINREHFRLGLWSGEAFLENVEIRLEAFDHLQLPFAIKQGFVGKLRLQVPWSKLGWEPILISLDDVIVLAGPHEESEYGAEASERRALAAKKAGLAAAEFAKLSQRVSEDKSGQTFLSYLSAKIIDNVQVTVTNVHIRYVDGKTDPERNFSFGITLASLSIRTTDGRDHPVLPGVSTAGKSGGNRVYKLVEVKQLAMYWNSDKTHGSAFGTSVDDDGFRSMPSLLATEEEVVYLLRPTNAILRLTVNKKATQGEGGPIYSVAATIDDLSLALVDRQLVQMLLLIDVLSMSRLRERYARFRPQISKADSESARMGWQRRLWVFAIQSVLSDVRKHLRRSSWSYLSWRSERQKRYVRLYKEKLESLHRVQPAGDQKWAELEEMEREFEMDEILYFRSLAENQFQLSRDVFMSTGNELEHDDNESDQRQAGDLSQQHLGQQRGWLNWLSLGLLGAAESIDAAVCPDEIIKDLCEAAADFNTTAEIESRKSIRGECRLILSVRVGGAFASLRNSLTKKEIVRMSVGGTLLTFSVWEESSSISITIPTLEIVDLCKPGSQFSRVLAPKTKRLLRSTSTAVVYQKSTDAGATMGIVHSSSENSLYHANYHAQIEIMPQSLPEQTDPLLKVEVEMNNKTQDFEVTVNVTIQPLEFVYSPALVDQTVDFFSEPISLYTRHELVISGSEKLESIVGHTRAKAEFAFATRKRVGWHLDMQRPTFLFPENDMDPEGMLMIWAWESLQITSAELQSSAFSSADMASSQRFWSAIGSTRCYERLEVNLVGVQVIIVGQTSNWYERLRHGADLGSHLVENFSLQIAVCCLPSDPTTMTRLKMSGELSSLRCHVSSGKCSTVKAIVTRMLESWERVKREYKDFQDGSNVEVGFQSLNTEKATCVDSNVSAIHKRRSSSLHGSNQASRLNKSGQMPAVLELNLTMKVVTMQLCIDGESNSELQHMTLIAQMQDASLRLKHWDSRDELLFVISRVHIEDTNELAGSSLRYLLFYSDGSSSVLKETASSSSTSSQSISNRSCFVAKFYRHSVNNMRNLRLDLSLQRMECYCHPKVMRALYGFIMTVTDTKTPETSVEKQIGSDSVDNVQSSGESTLVDTENEPGLVIGVKLKDVAFHLYDPGGIIAILILADANSSVFFTASRRGMMKVVAVIREVRVKGPRWASGNVGGDPFGNSSNGPAATLSITITKTWKRNSFSGLEYGVAEVDAAFQNARWILQNDYLAVLIGYCMSSEWKLSIKKDRSGKPEDLGSRSLSGDSRRTVFLFKVEVSDSVILFPGESSVEEHMELNVPKLLASFTPAEPARIKGVGSTSVASDSLLGGLDIVCVECRDIAVTVHGFHQCLESIVGDQFRLFENVEGEMIIKMPTSEVAAEVCKTGISSAIPIVTEIDLSDLHFTLAGWVSKKGVELLKRYQKDLSSIPWKYKTYASVGSRNDLRERSPFVQLTAPPTSNSSLSLKSTISHLTVFVRGPDEPLVNVSRMQADSVNIYLFLNQGVMEIVKIEALSLELLFGSSPKTLFSVTAENDSNGGGDSTDDLIPLLSLENSELQIALPCTKVWLHLFAWSKIISALISLGSSSQVKHANSTSVSSSDQILLQNDEGSSAVQSPNDILSDGGIMDSSDIVVSGGMDFVSNPVVGTSKTQDGRPVQLKVGVLNVVFILPDDVPEPKLDHRHHPLKREQSRPKLLWTGLGDTVENISVGCKVKEIQDGDRSMGKQILLTWSVRIDEIQANREGLCTLSACIMHAEAAVEETFGEGQRFHMRFLQANDIRIKGQINLEQSLNNSLLAVEVDSVDSWCSYNVLHFLNGFHLEPVKTVSSSATEFYCSLDVRLQSCSLLLSDSRWSCNAPIFEIVLKKIVSQVVWKRFDIEASSSTELEIHYHNIQKVAWEPLVEPWSVCSKISGLYEANTSSSSRPFKTKVELTSSAPLNVNVTESLIQAISRAVEMFSDSWKERSGDDASAGFKTRDPLSPESPSMRRYAPYWLQNDTGVPLSYWLCGASRNKENDDDAKTSSFGSARSSWGSLSGEVIQPGCSVPLYVEEGPDEVFVRRRAGKSADGYNARKIFNMLLLHRMICVQLEGTSRPSVPLSIDLVGSVSFEAVFSEDSGDGASRPNKGSFQEIESERGGSFSAPVIFEVTVHRYSKLVRVCSMVSLVNTTSVALELRFDIPFLISPKVMDPILPGHVMALPVHLAETGRMRWRPLGNNHLWSEVQLLPNLLEVGDTRLGFHRPVVCYPVNPSNGAFRCCIAVDNHPIPAAEAVAASKSKGEQRDGMGRSNGIDNLGIGSSSGSEYTKGCTLWDIFLKAPLVVKNCLPCSLAITIETNAGVMSNVSAPEGDSVFVYDIDTTQDLNLTFLASSFLPSSMKVGNAASFSMESGRNVAQDVKVTATQQFLFNPEVTTNASVTVEMEIDVDLVSGARELRISAPFWLYNCSYLNLAVMDGDVDLFSGREQPVGRGPTNDEERVEELSLHSTGSRSSPTSVNGLQVALEGPKHEIRVVKKPARLSSQPNRFAMLHRPVRLSLEKPLGKLQDGNVEDSQGPISEEQEKSVKDNVNSQFLMYSPVQGTDASELHLRVRIARSQSNDGGKELGEVRWSRPFLLEPPGGTTAVAIPQPDGNGAFVVAVISAPALGSCAGKTKSITFRPRFLLANVSKQVLCYKQQGTDKFQRLERGKHSQLHWHDVSREFLVSMRIDEHGWDWSGGFAPDQLGDTQVKVRNHTTGNMHMLRVEVSCMLASAGGAQIAGPAGGSLGTYLILLSEDETGFMPYRIENFTLERVRFHQQKCEKMENMLQPYSSCSYAWDEPCRPHRLIIEVPGAGDLGAFWLDEVKEYPPITLPATSEKAERKWLVHVRAEGPIRVLSIVDGTVHTMKGAAGVDGGATGDQFQETGQSVESNAELFEEFTVNLSYVGFSVIDTQPQEVIYACAKGLKLQLLQGRHQQILKVDVAWLQVDNQLRYAVYPVMLSVARAPPESFTVPQGTRTDVQPVDSQLKGLDLSKDATFSISVAKWSNPTGSVDCFQYIRMRLEPLRLELEERVVSCLLHLLETMSWSAFSTDSYLFVASNSEPWSVLRGSQLYGSSLQPFATSSWKYDMVHIPTSNIMRFTKLVQRLDSYRCWASAVAVEPINWQSQKLFLFAKERRKAYIEMLHVAPFILNVSFSSAPWLSDEMGGAATRSLLWMTGTLLQRQVRALADVEGAPVHLRQLKLAHPFASWDVIRGMITRHYTRQLLQEVYKVLGSADVFGNPVGFIRSMASGMWEFVSAPTRSSVQSPTELVRGVAQGTSSLFTNTVFAFSNAATRMSRAARKGVTVFTLDSEYDQAMERLLRLEGSEEVSVVNEFLEGLTGLLQAPIRGAERHGLPGMLSGMALGVVGVVARPVASILEVAGMTAQSIRNRSRPIQWHATRVRLPRHVNAYSPLMLYSWERAAGQAVLLEAEGGRFKNEVYFTCKPLVQGGKFLLLTESKILRVGTATLADATAARNAVYGPKWKLDLEGEIDDILHVDQVDNEVSVLLGPPMRPLIRPHHQGVGSSKYTARFTPFAHETFALVSQSASDEVLEMLRLLDEQHRKARSKLLLASSTSISCPEFLDLDKYF